MNSNSNILPFSKDPAIRLLPWIIALVVYLATITLAGGLLVTMFAAEWNKGLSHAITVHVVPQENESTAELDARVAATTRVILKTPGIASARPIPLREVAKMLEPWLGASANLSDIPLPRLIDVGISPDVDPPTEVLAENLRKAVPGAEIDDHQIWRQRLLIFFHSLEAVAVIMVILIALTAVAVVSFSTRSGLAAHRQIIEILHLIGTEDEFIASEFERRSRKLGLIGGFGGWIFAVLTILALGLLAKHLDAIIITPNAAYLWFIPVLAAVPILSAYIVKWTARRVVMQALNKML